MVVPANVSADCIVSALDEYDDDIAFEAVPNKDPVKLPVIFVVTIKTPTDMVAAVTCTESILLAEIIDADIMEAVKAPTVIELVLVNCKDEEIIPEGSGIDEIYEAVKDSKD